MGEKITVKERYEQLAKEGTLPSYDTFTAIIDIRNLDSEQFDCSDLIKKIGDKLALIQDLLDDLLQPESYTAMTESNAFGKEERKNISVLFRKVAYANKEVLLDRFDTEDKTERINTLFATLQEAQQKIIPLLQTSRDVWTKETTVEQEEEKYFG